MRRRVLILLAAAVRAEPVLDRAAIPMRPADWLAVRLVAAYAAYAAGLLLTALLPWWAGLPLGLIAGFALCGLALRVRVSRRERVFADELPGTLRASPDEDVLRTQTHSRRTKPSN
jgi:hypothetical protein